MKRWLNKLDGLIAKGFGITYELKQELIDTIENANTLELAAAIEPFLVELGPIGPIIAGLAAFLGKEGILQIIEGLPYLATEGMLPEKNAIPLIPLSAPNVPGMPVPVSDITPVQPQIPTLSMLPKRDIGNYAVIYGVHTATKKEIAKSTLPERMVVNTRLHQAPVNPTFGRVGF